MAAEKASSVFQSIEKRREKELLKQLQTMPVRQVVVPETSVLPKEVVQLAAKHSGVIGNPLRTDRVQDFARSLKHWYSRQGYILHSVTGATLNADTATAEIAVEEPRIAEAPVEITFCKEMVIDNETGDLMTFREYRDKHQQRRLLGFDNLSKDNLNTTYVTTDGRTKPRRVASALGLTAGRPFQWDGNKWRNVVTCGVFARVLQASPRPMPDGSAQLHIIATEAPPRHLEYGMGRSLYTGSWEGELDFEHGNLLGGGEKLGLSVRRGAKDSIPSVQLSFSDSRFGTAGGYDVQVFSDFLGAKTEKMAKTESQDDSLVVDDDGLVNRMGLRLSVQNPVTQRILQHSGVSASLERTTAKSGAHESIGSATLNVGPFVNQLPFQARSNVDVSFTTGTRLVRGITSEAKSFSSSDCLFLPYSSVTATTKQIFPLLNIPSSESVSTRPLVLALRHSLTTSTSNLPRHEAKAQGVSNDIRGSEPNGPISSAIRGTTELRLPVPVPFVKTQQDASLVVFGDWLVATENSLSPFHRKSSVGAGIRKSVQGIPLHVDLSYSKETKLKVSCGLGRDFDV